jgi:cytidylate kinase
VSVVIAIDGPSGSGKGTLSEKLAGALNFARLDSGILYRAFACMEMLLSNRDCFADYGKSNKHFSQKLLDIFHMDDCCENFSMASYLMNDNFFSSISTAGDLIAIAKNFPARFIRSEKLGMKASTLGKTPKVRDTINEIIRKYANSVSDSHCGIVVDGRDVGTVVFPKAQCKIFITADLKIRAMRRFAMAKKADISMTFEKIYESLKKRDEQDSKGIDAPLSFNDEYIIIDTSNDTVEETFTKLVKLVNAKLVL